MCVFVKGGHREVSRSNECRTLLKAYISYTATFNIFFISDTFFLCTSFLTPSLLVSLFLSVCHSQTYLLDSYMLLLLCGWRWGALIAFVALQSPRCFDDDVFYLFFQKQKLVGTIESPYLTIASCSSPTNLNNCVRTRINARARASRQKGQKDTYKHTHSPVSQCQWRLTKHCIVWEK